MHPFLHTEYLEASTRGGCKDAAGDRAKQRDEGRIAMHSGW